MQVPRQESQSENSGRVNQKRRTREAVVAAAQRLVGQGVTPTVASAAEEALVSRTTAYRYFPTQESLLVELAVTIDITEIEDMVARPLKKEEVPGRLLELLDQGNHHVLDDEVLYRRALRVYLDMWLAARQDNGATPILRAGRRARFIEDTLAPLRDTVPAVELRRLQAALCLVTGVEPMVVLLDVCRLEPEEALGVTRWVAESILAAALGQQP